MKPSRWLIPFVLTLSFILGGLTGGLFMSHLYQLPQVEQLEEYFPPVSTLIYSSDNCLIAQFYRQQRVFIPLAEIPRHLINAFLAVEDADFYSHHGIDLKGILRAFYVNLKAGRIREGGSTITQQLAKVLFLTPDRNLGRKIKEAILAIQIERKYTKDEILELYMNQIYLGNGAYGVESAARTIFGRSAKELNLPESALIAGLPSSPNRYSPQNNLDLSLKRRNHVLQRMLDERYISKEQYASAISLPLRIVHSAEKTIAPYFLEHVRRYLEEQYGPNLLYKGGLQVFTTLDKQMQKAAEEAMMKGLERIDLRRADAKDYSEGDARDYGEGDARDYGEGDTWDYGETGDGNQLTQGALIAIDPGNGYVKAMIGGRDFELSEFNRATQARRQPGSAMKPIIYTAAIESGYTAADIFIDSPFIMHNGHERGEAWSPENFSRRFCGPVTLRTALEKSINVVAVKLLNKIGIDVAVSYARKMGIKSPLAPYLSLALGTSGVSLMELTSAYGVLANEGVYVEPVFIRRVMDREGRRVLEDNFVRSERIVSPETAYILTSMLQGVIQRGTGQLAKVLPYRLAGKTGTTDQYADAWFIGYCPDLVAGVWVGLDNNQSLGEGETGSRAACPIWVSFMDEVLSSWDQVSDFSIPDGLSFVFIDPETGLLAGENSYDKFLEVFREGSEPRLYSKQRKGLRFKNNDFYLNFIE